jgi:flagellar biosynthesis/type III secretory pathway protein FliH
MLAEKNDVLRHAVDELYRVSASDEIRAQYEARDKAWRDHYSRLQYAEKQGEAKGLKEGEVKGIKKGEAKGLKKGIKQGIKQGRTEGIEEGRAEGIEEGRAEGIEEGRAESKAQIEQLKRELARFQQNHD